MYRKSNLFLLLSCLLVFITVLIVSCANANSQDNTSVPDNPTVRWEYSYISNYGNMAEFIHKSNELGQNGWELVIANSGIWIFKRRLP